MIEVDLTLHRETLNLSQTHTQKLVDDINSCITSGKIVDPQICPKYQTFADLFDRPEAHWQELKNLIYEKVLPYYDVKAARVRAWAYVECGDTLENTETPRWHKHNLQGLVCSAIFYLKVPESSYATEFMDKDGNVYRPKLFEQLLIIHDSSAKHRPPLRTERQPSEDRYVIAIDYFNQEGKMTDFQNKGYVLVKGFLDPASVSIVSRYLENALRRYPENNQGGGQGDSSKISYYADPLIEMILQDKLQHVEEVTGYKLFPSYSFTRVYQKGEELTPHVDRPACEISLTCHIATVGKPWSVWMQTPGGEPTEYTLEPGDACVYKGCEIKHWRNPATETDINVQMMLHYVNQNGPCASYKYDERPGLSLRK